MIYIVFGALGLCFDNLFWSEAQDCVGTRVFRQFPVVCLQTTCRHPWARCRQPDLLLSDMYLYSLTVSLDLRAYNILCLSTAPESNQSPSGTDWTLGLAEVAHLLCIEKSMCTGYSGYHQNTLEEISLHGNVEPQRHSSLSANRTINQLLTPQTCALVWESPVKATLGGV